MKNHSTQDPDRSTALPVLAPDAHLARPGPFMRALARADTLMNRVFGSRYNPLYQSGAIASLLLLVLLVTGLYLLLFYRIGDPHASVARINEQLWAGRWIRALHRYSSAAMVVAVGVHALRMLLQRRSWGPRALAWLSGMALVGVVFVAGWTGYVMIWDEHGRVLAVEGARLLDLLPLFPEPLVRTFAGVEALPGAFFFLNLFLHIALPVGMALVLWLHVSRVARPALLPPRGLLVALLLLLVGASVIWPLPVWPEADLLSLPGAIPLDVFYGFWVPAMRYVPPWAIWAIGAAGVTAIAAVPILQRPAERRSPAPSVVDERLCTGCEQCYVDCPYDAIRMETRTDGRVGLVAFVDEALCVSCGICAGSCAPMGVGPPGRTGRDQLASLRAMLASEPLAPGLPVVLACSRGAGGVVERPAILGGDARVIGIDCAGNLHTSAIELLIREGAGGVMVAACPPRDCWNREGAKWLEQRMYHDREAELQERVDRRRVGLVTASLADAGVVRDGLEALRDRISMIAPPAGGDEGELGAECRRPGDDDPADANAPAGVGGGP